MSERSIARDVSQLDIAMDSWTEPFWQAASQERLVVPRCQDCGHFRWPPGPFCPQCQSQATEWVSPGTGRIFSYTVVPTSRSRSEAPLQHYVPALVRFADAGNTLLLGALIDAPLEAIRIDAEVIVDWMSAANTKVPVFRLAQ